MSKNKFGEFPFEKGIYKNMYKDRLWTMRQYAGFSSVNESNKRYLKLIESGVSGLSIAFDLPTQIGYDSDDDMSFGEIGKSGVPISTIEDMENLFKDIDLEKISVSMTINSTAAILLAFYTILMLQTTYFVTHIRLAIKSNREIPQKTRSETPIVEYANDWQSNRKNPNRLKTTFIGGVFTQTDTT